MERKYDTIGRKAVEAMSKEPEVFDPIELEREMHKDYVETVYKTVEDGKKVYPGDFFVVVLTKRERLLANVMRHYHFHRKTCPTPSYDQAVYKYHKEHDALEFIWIIPSKESCQMMITSPIEFTGPERDLLNFVLDFTDGTLLNKAKELNGERKNSILLEE